MTGLAPSASTIPIAAPALRAERPLRILLVGSAHNSLSQRIFIALTDLGHDVSVEVVDSSAAIEAAVARHTTDLIVCPMLKSIIPESVWRKHRCLIVHPGPRGDRGPSSLDWAIELEMAEWGVTVLEATGEVDGGGVWASRTFRTRQAGKSSLYRHEVRRAAVEGVVDAVTMVAAGGRAAEPVDYGELGAYVLKHEISVDGPLRESYLRGFLDTPAADEWETEIGWPIFRADARS